MNILDIIIEIRDTQGTNAKLDLLKKYNTNDMFCKVLFYTYNPFYKYYIKKIPSIKELWSCLGDYNSMFQLLDNLRNRVYTGNTALEVVSNFINHSPYHLANLFKLILGRDLKMGVNTTSINKMIPNLIPTFDVMLASADIDMNKVFAENEFVYVQKKSDGKRCIAVCKMDDGNVSVDFFARSGKEIENLSKHEVLINAITTIRQSRIPVDFILDGEIIIENSDGSDADRQYSNGLIAQKDLEKSEVERFSFVVWDLISLEDFINNSNKIKYEDRYYLLLKSLRTLSNIKVIETFTAGTIDKVYEITNNYIKNGFEGSIVKIPKHFYQRKRSKDWIKFKNILECDLRVVGFNHGSVGTKYETLLGALMMESEDGKVKVGVGTGFNDNNRTNLTAGNTIGKIATVQYNQLIKDVNNQYSLYLPRFIELRDDKNIADDFNKIQRNG